MSSSPTRRLLVAAGVALPALVVPKLSSNLTGSLLRFAPGSGQPEVIASEGLVAPSSVAVAEDGSIHISNFGYFPEQGQVVRLALSR